ncbi:MAG: hypothetical protein E7379_04195 [Clostridiales bacterium]|nr:hypothetical protein [Clostridiales bacterium]
MGYGWDVEDVEDISAGPDNSHPYGKDVDHSKEAGQDKNQDGKQDETEKKKSKKEDVKDLDKEDKKKKKQKKQKDAWDPEVTKANAKAHEMPDKLFPINCPDCHKQTLYSDKMMPTGIRLGAYITLSCFGAMPFDKAVTSLHLRCMNTKCPSYWKKTGVYFTLSQTNPSKPDKHKSIFHIDR